MNIRFIGNNLPKLSTDQMREVDRPRQTSTEVDSPCAGVASDGLV